MVCLPTAANALTVPEEIEAIRQALAVRAGAHVIALVAVEVGGLLLRWPPEIAAQPARHPGLHEPDAPVVADPVLAEHVVVAADDEDAGADRHAGARAHSPPLDSA